MKNHLSIYTLPQALFPHEKKRNHGNMIFLKKKTRTTIFKSSYIQCRRRLPPPPPKKKKKKEKNKHEKEMEIITMKKMNIFNKSRTHI